MDGCMGRQMDESMNQSRTIFWWINLGPFIFLAAFPFQVRIAIYYPNYRVIRPPTKMLTWPALIFSRYLTTDLKTFILSKYHQPFSGCLFIFMLVLCANCMFLYFIIYITVVMLLVTAFFSELSKNLMWLSFKKPFEGAAVWLSPRQWALVMIYKVENKCMFFRSVSPT